MSGGTVSLEKSVRTCDVNVGEANRIQSDRFFNPSLMVCPIWNGIDLVGRTVNPDSFYTKSAGCNSAEDRVMVENAQRPKYMSYVTLGAQGISGYIYGNESAKCNAIQRDKFDRERRQYTGNYGLQFGANVENTSCSLHAYERAMSQVAQQERQQVALQNGYLTANNRSSCGY